MKSFAEDIDKFEPSNVAGVSLKWYSCYGKQFLKVLNIIHNSLRWEQAKHPSIDEQISKMWYIPTVKRFCQKQRNDILVHVTVWINIANIILSEIWQCWAVPYQPASLVFAQPRDRRKSLETVTEIKILWTGDLPPPKLKVLDGYPAKYGRWQAGHGSNLLLGGGGHHLQGELTLGWLTSYQGNQQPGHLPHSPSG